MENFSRERDKSVKWKKKKNFWEENNIEDIKKS